MKDYSKFVRNPSGYIIDYEVKNGEIVVNTKKTEKGEPHKYEATKKSIRYYEERLEKQYKMIISKQDEILQSKIDVKNTIYVVLILVICVLSALSSEFSEIFGMFLSGVGVFTTLIHSIDIVLYTKKFRTELKIYDDFLRDRNKIENSSVIDKNIIKYLGSQTLEVFNKNCELKNNDLIDNVLNVNFMDKVSLQDLKKILLRYRISEGLQEEMIYQSKESVISCGRINKKTRKKVREKR